MSISDHEGSTIDRFALVSTHLLQEMSYLIGDARHGATCLRSLWRPSLTEPLQSPIKADSLQWTSFVTVQLQQTSYVTFQTIRHSIQFVLEIYGQGWGKHMVTWKQRSQHIQITSSDIGSLTAHWQSTTRWLSFNNGIEKLRHMKQTTHNDRFLFELFPPQQSHLNSIFLCLTLYNHVI